jgi:hypothetical protein
MLNTTHSIRQQIERSIQHLLCEQNRDPFSKTYGCFDRRFWAWKITDYPESTFQRNVYPLAWLLKHTNQQRKEIIDVLIEAITAGLKYATQIQHKNGSFDQAFPYEHSFGATAFLLESLLKSYQIIQNKCSFPLKKQFERCLRLSADFLCHHNETHGFISNHQASAVLSLLTSAAFFNDMKYERRAIELLNTILTNQSKEGWFLEYNGADPGYQTLSIHYLAQVYKRKPEAKLKSAIQKALSFLSWFVHPDGTFGGEYGSRRTAIYYPGGIALLSSEFPTAGSICRFMIKSIIENRTVTLDQIDMGNLAPLLSSYLLLLDTYPSDQLQNVPLLPFEKESVNQNFPDGGFYIRGTHQYYAIVGVSNGGVLKIFDKKRKVIMRNDCGYFGQTKKGAYITTQITDRSCSCQIKSNKIEIYTPFYEVSQIIPTASLFIVLRLLNLTIMRNIKLGNYVKRLLVKVLMKEKQIAPLVLTRKLRFDNDKVFVHDILQLKKSLCLSWLKFGQSFVAIHMSSGRYFENFLTARKSLSSQQVDVEGLRMRGKIEIKVSI